MVMMILYTSLGIISIISPALYLLSFLPELTLAMLMCIGKLQFIGVFFVTKFPSYSRKTSYSFSIDSPKL